MNAHTFTIILSLAMIAPVVSHASTNETEHLPPQLKHIAGVAKAVSLIPKLTVRRNSVWEGGWHVFSTDIVAKIEREGHVKHEEIATNQFAQADAYYQQFTIADTLHGFVKYGSFPTRDEAHSAFIFATTTTASPWYSDAAIAVQLTPKPDEVLFAERHTCIIRRGTTCVHVAVFGAAEDACMKLVIEIASRILAEMDAAGTSN